ncbi:MAG: PstS family phosphate ABC transporter substrate-binding protein [Caldilinea sp. CFX5]|nr:PstS family phosphate ABC transporter substrate-binding protein [Caldilinea sp. CFX5]
MFRTRFLLISLVLVLLLAACAPTAAPAPSAAAPATEAPAEAPASEAVTTTTEVTGATAVTGTTDAAAGAMAELPEVNPLEVTGDIITAGSSTVFPLTEAMANRFVDEGYAGNITVDSIGTGAGFERFCVAGETDIANASRAIKDSEIESCRAINREPIEFRVGTDALAIVLNPENTWVTDLTTEQVAKLFSTDVVNWSDVDPSWPAEPVLRFSPGTDSGTFDYFIEAVMTPAFGEEAEAKLLDAGNLQLSEDDNVLSQGVQGDKNAIGYFGYAFYHANETGLKLATINGVVGNAEDVDNGTYPLARPLFIYSDAKILQEKPQVAAFINFYLTYVDEEVIDVGYFPAPAAALEEAKSHWVAAMQ